MSNLNPTQFKIDLGNRTFNRVHDEGESLAAKRLADDGPRPDTGKPDPGYYDQPSSNVRQQALPGMEMSVEDHLEALENRVGGNSLARVSNGDNYHSLSVAHPSGVVSNLLWGGHRTAQPIRDVGRQSGTGYPGEIRSVTSYEKGTASAMLSTAEALAHEHGYTFPNHSEMRTNPGVRWSQKMMRKRGEQVW